MTNVKDILSNYNIPWAGEEHKHGRPGWVQIDCPYCGGAGSRRFHLGISLSTGACSCWKCGGKNVVKVLAYITRKPYKTILEDLKAVVYQKHETKKTGTLTLPTGRTVLLGGHKGYLKERGFDCEEITRLWGVQGMGQGAYVKSPIKEGQRIKLDWRIFIPIHHDGEIVSWTSRAIQKNSNLRYLSAPSAYEAIPHKHILYGSDYARHAIIIHEGPIDVWATGPGAVATCGTAYTNEQVLEMVKYPNRVVCFDSSPDAQRRAEILAHELSMFPGQTHNVMLETGDDAAAADRTEIEELRRRFSI